MRFQKNQSIFICGTDTGVGKTFITGHLCRLLNAQGIKVGAYKPLESGCGPSIKVPKQHLNRADSIFLKKMAKMKENINVINPYYFKEALAPGVAAWIEKRKISFKKIKKNLNNLKKNYDLIFIEGAGGLLVPISGTKTNLDLTKFLKTPVMLIARLGLGTINHTLLTLEHLKRNRVPIVGVILNELTPQKTIAEKTNPAILKKYGVPLLGVFPHKKIWPNKSQT